MIRSALNNGAVLKFYGHIGLIRVRLLAEEKYIRLSVQVFFFFFLVHTVVLGTTLFQQILRPLGRPNEQPAAGVCIFAFQLWQILS